MFRRGSFGWKDSDEFEAAVSTSLLFGFLYLISMSDSGKFVSGHVVIAGVFAGIGLAIFGLNREVSLSWAGVSGFVIGVMVYLQMVAFRQGASGPVEAGLLLANIPIMMVLFMGSYLAVSHLRDRL